MEADNDRNLAADLDYTEEYLEYKPNFITITWDDRSKASKIGVIALFIAIIIVTTTLVILNISIHYKGYYKLKIDKAKNEINCNLVKSEDYAFVARIHSASTKEMLCVGAVVGPNTVLASQVCVKAGPVRIRVGSFSNPTCRIGFGILITETIPHDGIISKNIVLLTTKDSLNDCASPITLGVNFNWDKPVILIGRPLAGVNTLSRQTALIVRDGDCVFTSDKTARRANNSTENKSPSLLCVKDTKKCVIRAGDLLVQNGELYGFASTSSQQNDKKTLIPFANLEIIHRELHDLQVRVGVVNTKLRTIELTSF